MPYISNTAQQTREMLADIGLTMEGLFADIDKQLMHEHFDLPEGINEQRVCELMHDLARKNHTGLISFLGAGFYDHFVPAAVKSIISRSEFYTSYTPYQPELAQGMLQAMYEYQSSICRLTDMEVANASLYDGGTAIYEAIMMALRITRRNKVIIDDSLNPIYRVMVRSYTRNLNIQLREESCGDGQVNRNAIFNSLDDDTAAVILQNPNFFGCVDDFTDIAEMAHQKGAILVTSCYPLSLGMLKTPGRMNADIATGEGQSLGLPLSFGGPYLGYMAARKEYVRKMPGRIVGETVDKKGQRAFVLTLQPREQHIRRAKATSNICSNQALCALAAVVYLSLQGKHGLTETAELCANKAAYVHQRLTAIPGVKPHFEGKPFFNEFVLDMPRESGEVIAALIEKGFAPGFPLARYYENMENSILISVTEKNTKEQIGMFAEALESVL